MTLIPIAVLESLEWLVTAIIIAIAATQVIWPILIGTRMFPMYHAWKERRRSRPTVVFPTSAMNEDHHESDDRQV